MDFVSTLLYCPGTANIVFLVKVLTLYPAHLSSSRTSTRYRLSRDYFTLVVYLTPLHATHLTPRGASRLMQAMSAWSVKTRRAPSRHCRNARVFGQTTTAMQEDEYPPSSLSLSVGNDVVKHASQCVSYTTRAPFLLFRGHHGWRSQ